MPTQRNLLGSGCPALQSQASVGILSTALTATGSSLATALVAPSDFMVFTTVAASTGVALPVSAKGAATAGDSFIVVNHGANALSVYPGTAAGTIANGSAGAAFSVPITKTATFLCLGSDNWAASVSA